MALSKVTYVDGVTIIGAKNLNDIQDELIRQGEQQAEDEASLAGKAEASEMTAALALKADKTETYTKAQVDSMIQEAVEEAVKESEYSNFEMKSVSGDFIHITDGAGLIPVKDLKIGIDAVQDLHGYDAPWVGGAGKNLFQKTDYAGAYNTSVGTDLATGTANANYIMQNDGANFNFTATWQTRLFATAPLSAGEYTISMYSSTTGIRSSVYVTDGDLKVATFVKNYSTQGSFPPETVTVTAGQRIAFVASANATGSCLMAFQVEAGSSATTYERFENICPISGWTVAKVSVTGKNLLDASNISWTTGIRDDNGNIISGGSHFTNMIYGFDPNTQYTINGTLKTTGSYRIYYLKKDGSWIGRTEQLSTPPATFTTPNECGAIQIQVTVSITDLDDVQVELGSTATEYESFGKVYSVTWETEAGTVYGGTLDVTTGELTVNWRKILIDGENLQVAEWGATSRGYAVYYAPSNYVRNRGSAISDLFFENNSGYASMPAGSFIGSSGASSTITFVLPQTVTSKAEANAWFAQNPTTVVYKLAEPVSYTIDPTEVLTLLGENNIFADTGAVEELIYRISRQ